MVGPTKRKPRFFKSFDINSAIGGAGGTSFELRKLFWIGAPPTKSHRYWEKSGIAR